jgi:hypothetical protein
VSTSVYTVHAVRPEEICATEVIFNSPEQAEDWARAVSTDPDVLAGAVTRYRLNAPGERKPVALFVNGERQEIPHLSNDRQIAANGYITSRTLRRAWRDRPS